MSNHPPSDPHKKTKTAIAIMAIVSIDDNDHGEESVDTISLLYAQIEEIDKRIKSPFRKKDYLAAADWCDPLQGERR